MKKQPRVRMTHTMIMTYHGGSCNPASNKNQKRGKIKYFTRASQRRLCLYADTLIDFIPTRLLVMEFDKKSDCKTMTDSMLDFCKKITKYLVKAGYKAPLFIWRKLYVTNNLYEYIIITNIPQFFKESDLALILKYLWKHGELLTVQISRKTYRNAIRHFCMMKTNTPPPGSSPGKFWGTINRHLYTNGKPIEITTTLLELLKLEAQAAIPPDSEKFQKNIYIKK